MVEIRRESGTGQGVTDTHCHLFLMEGDAGEIVAAVREAGVPRMLCVGIDPDTSRRSLALAESFAGVFATAGTHPHTASRFDREAGATIEELLAHPLVVAVGETGLDYYRRLSPVEDQRAAFRSHIALSRAVGKPLVVHVRDAWGDAMSILEQEGAEDVVLHCFSAGEELAREATARGYYVSFAGNLTYPSTERLRRAAATVPSDRLLVETDSPFLPPQPMRGSKNTPANLHVVLETLAAIRHLRLEETAESTSISASSAFRFVR